MVGRTKKKVVWLGLECKNLIWALKCNYVRYYNYVTQTQLVGVVKV